MQTGITPVFDRDGRFQYFQALAAGGGRALCVARQPPETGLKRFSLYCGNRAGSRLDELVKSQHLDFWPQHLEVSKNLCLYILFQKFFRPTFYETIRLESSEMEGHKLS
jgi:hypothetical protein